MSDKAWRAELARRASVFMSEEARSRDTIDFKKAYCDMASGDLVCGVVLSQLVYWHLLSASGERKLWVVHDGEYWLARKREDWWDECRVHPSRLDRALEHLEFLGIIEKRIYKFKGTPQLHIRIQWAKFLELWDVHKLKVELDLSPPEGDSGQAELPVIESARLKSKDVGDESDNRPAAVREYTRVTGIYPAPGGLQWRRIVEAVTTDKLAEWSRLLEDWTLSGMNTNNVARLLLAFRQGWKPTLPGKRAEEATPTMTDAELKRFRESKGWLQ